MLGYKSLKQFLATFASILAFAVFTFLVRLAKFDELTLQQHLDIFAVSVIVAAVFWESLRLVNYWLNSVYSFEQNITGRIVVQLVLGTVIGLVIRLVIYRWGE